MRADSRELPLSAIPLCQLLPCHPWPPRPTLSINLYVKGCFDCTIGAFHMSILLSFRMRSRSSMPSRTSSSMDLVVTMSCNLTLQICLIIALSFRCRCWRFDCQWPSPAGMEHCALHTRAVHMATCFERGGSKTALNFFQAVFSSVVVESSQPPAAESMSPR